MGTLRQRLAWLCLFVALTVVGPSTAAGHSAPPHLVAAEELVEHVQPVDSSYQHRHTLVHWGDHGRGRYESHADCSGLVNRLLEHAYGIAPAELDHWLDSGRPKASSYHRAIAERNGFERITRVEEVLPGDIIAIRYPRGSGNTGHVMIVADVPRARPATPPVIAGTRQWEVSIIDSTTSDHGQGDTRHSASGHFHPGVGRGVIRLYTDAAGHVVGHTWSTSSHSPYREQQARHVEIGRLTREF